MDIIAPMNKEREVDERKSPQQIFKETVQAQIMQGNVNGAMTTMQTTDNLFTGLDEGYGNPGDARYENVREQIN